VQNLKYTIKPADNQADSDVWLLKEVQEALDDPRRSFAPLCNSAARATKQRSLRKQPKSP
jgi:hypothetical protein